MAYQSHTDGPEPTSVPALVLSYASKAVQHDDFEAARWRGQLLKNDPVVVADGTLSALRSPALPPAVDRADLVQAAADLLAHFIDDTPVRERMVAALDDPAARGAVLEACALVSAPQMRTALVSVVVTERFTGWAEEDIIRLILAFGAVGGREARESVAMLRSRGGWSAIVERELEVADSMLFHE